MKLASAWPIEDPNQLKVLARKVWPVACRICSSPHRTSPAKALQMMIFMLLLVLFIFVTTQSLCTTFQTFSSKKKLLQLCSAPPFPLLGCQSVPCARRHPWQWEQLLSSDAPRNCCFWVLVRSRYRTRSCPRRPSEHSISLRVLYEAKALLCIKRPQMQLDFFLSC